MNLEAGGWGLEAGEIWGWGDERLEAGGWAGGRYDESRLANRGPRFREQALAKVGGSTGLVPVDNPKSVSVSAASLTRTERREEFPAYAGPTEQREQVPGARDSCGLTPRPGRHRPERVDPDKDRTT